MNRAHILGMFLALAVFLVGGGAAARPDRGTVLRATVVNGAGRVMTSDGRLNCRTRCSIRYQRGTIRRLTAKPAAHYLFTRWVGDCIGTAPNCDVALDRATSVRAGFGENGRSRDLGRRPRARDERPGRDQLWRRGPRVQPGGALMGRRSR